jgi:hypothetical protein
MELGGKLVLQCSAVLVTSLSLSWYDQKVLKRGQDVLIYFLLGEEVLSTHHEKIPVGG